MNWFQFLSPTRSLTYLLVGAFLSRLLSLAHIICKHTIVVCALSVNISSRLNVPSSVLTFIGASIVYQQQQQKRRSGSAKRASNVNPAQIVVYVGI